MNRYVFKIIIFLILSGNILADHYIFSALENNDMKAIYREMSRGVRFKSARNNAQESVIQVALRKKNIPALRALIQHGALVLEQDVYYALKVFFNIDEDFFTDHHNDLFNDWLEDDSDPHVAKKFVAAIKESLKDNQPSSFLSIADIFLTPKQASSYSRMIKLDKTTINAITEQFSEVFFKETVDVELIKIVIRNLLAPDNIHSILLLLSNLYEDAQKTHLVTPKQSLSPTMQLQKSHRVSLAILEYSRQLFAPLTSKIIFSYALFDIPQPEITALLEYSNRLSRFVERTLTSRKKYKYSLRNYQFWYQVYVNLYIEGDFMSALAIATGLNHSAVQKTIKAKHLLSTPLINMDNNFQIYRNMLRAHINNGYLPSLHIVLKDLAFLKESGVVYHDNNRESSRLIPHLAKLRQELIKSLTWARTTQFAADNDLIKALKLLPSYEIFPNELPWCKIYNTLIHGLPLKL